ncbi:hypothetical protein Patl1_06130 [Pistacia atlantica]|uniref:Uncharacterized protein n=1 Tax=Pistacia atlantica TaxID=434234 RepID=A0ACC1BPF3_9ROSI|nr:hypothetical protein Patl1_06130 [Pistacia atlantica]
MQISAALLFFLSSSLFLATVHGSAPSPSPISNTISSSSVQNFPSSPESSFDSIAPVPVTENNESPKSGLAPSPAPQLDKSFSSPHNFIPSPAPSFDSSVPVTEEEEEEEESGKSGDEAVAGSETLNLRWCTVREEFEECQYIVSAFDQSDDYTWKCSKQKILPGERGHQLDFFSRAINLAMEVTPQQPVGTTPSTKSNNHYLIQEKRSMTMKSHRVSSPRFARLLNWKELMMVCVVDAENKNGTTCHDTNSLYSGEAGAFRCLVEGLGDIAFLKGDTALLFSREGPNNQSWATKSVRDFMYLCPQGGCREINGYPGSCSFGTVPANVIMASNSIPNKKRLFVLQTLTNATKINALYEGNSGRFTQLLSPRQTRLFCSTQELLAVKKLTRSYLGKSASISQRIQELNNPEPQVTPSTLYPLQDVSSSSPRLHNSLVITFFSILIIELLLHTLCCLHSTTMRVASAGFGPLAMEINITRAKIKLTRMATLPASITNKKITSVFIGNNRSPGRPVGSRPGSDVHSRNNSGDRVI